MIREPWALVRSGFTRARTCAVEPGPRATPSLSGGATIDRLTRVPVGPAVRRPSGREGTALVIVLGAMLVLSAMGLALVLLAMSHTLATSNERRATAALYAAEAGLERALPDLLRAANWDAVLDGAVRSGFNDGLAGGTRLLADGRRLDLDALAAFANCGVAANCSDAQMNAVTAERPWGPNNPRWRLFAHGRLADLLPASALLPPPEYLVVLVADDPSEVDGDPLHDGLPGTSPGAGILQLRAEAFGPDAAHRAIEVGVARGVSRPPAGGYAGQRGEGAVGGGASGGDLQIPGDSLIRSSMTLGGGLARQ